MTHPIDVTAVKVTTAAGQSRRVLTLARLVQEDPTYAPDMAYSEVLLTWDSPQALEAFLTAQDLEPRYDDEAEEFLADYANARGSDSEDEEDL